MLYKKSYISLTIHTKQKRFLKIMKKQQQQQQQHQHHQQQQQPLIIQSLKIIFIPCNTCTAEPKLEVLPFT